MKFSAVEEFKEYQIKNIGETKIIFNSLSGNDSSEQRKIVFDEMKKMEGDFIKLLSNCNILKEGIDIPMLDFLIFNDPKFSFI